MAALVDLLTFVQANPGCHTSHWKRRVALKAISRGYLAIVSPFYDDGWRVVLTDDGRKELAAYGECDCCGGRDRRLSFAICYGIDTNGCEECAQCP